MTNTDKIKVPKNKISVFTNMISAYQAISIINEFSKIEVAKWLLKFYDLDCPESTQIRKLMDVNIILSDLHHIVRVSPSEHSKMSASTILIEFYKKNGPIDKEDL